MERAEDGGGRPASYDPVSQMLLPPPYAPPTYPPSPQYQPPTQGNTILHLIAKC